MKGVFRQAQAMEDGTTIIAQFIPSPDRETPIELCISSGGMDTIIVKFSPSEASFMLYRLRLLLGD